MTTTTSKYEIWELLHSMFGNILALQPKHIANIQRNICVSAQYISNFLVAKVERISLAKRSGEKAGIAVIPIYGVITKGNSGYYDEVSTDSVRAELNAALANTSVKGILLDIASPGGTVLDVPELADEIHSARAVKPIHAYANGLAASAAYWLGASASEMSSMPSGCVGSVGVYMMHTDLSAMMKNIGVSIEFVKAGKYKTEANEFEPLSDEAKAFLQTEVDAIYKQFLVSVARGRGFESKDNFGDGRVFSGRDAKSMGLIDGVASFGGALARLARVARGQIVPQAEVAPSTVRGEVLIDRQIALARRKKTFLGS